MSFGPYVSTMSSTNASTSTSSTPSASQQSLPLLLGNDEPIVSARNVSSSLPLFVYKDSNKSLLAMMNNNKNNNNNNKVTKVELKSVTTAELIILVSVISMVLILLIGAFVYFVSIYFKKKGRSKSFDLDKSRREAEAAEQQRSRNQLTMGPNGEFISGPKWCCTGAAQSVPLDIHCGRDCRCGWVGIASCMRSCGSYDLDVPGDGCC